MPLITNYELRARRRSEMRKTPHSEAGHSTDGIMGSIRYRGSTLRYAMEWLVIELDLPD